MDNAPQQKNLAIRGCCAEARQDITHAQALLRDAVGKLIEETLALQNGCDAVLREMLGRQADGPHEPAHEQLLLLHRMVTERTHASLLQLQFQDMATQVLEHAKEGVQRVVTMVLKTPLKTGEGAQPDGGVFVPDAEADVRKSLSCHATCRWAMWIFSERMERQEEMA